MTARLHWVENTIEAAFKAASLLMWAHVSILFVLLSATSALAAPSGGYVTQLGQRVLALCDKVAIGEVTAVNPPFRGVTTARLSITEKLGGLDRPRKSVTLMYISDYLAPDAIRSTFEESSVTFRPRRSERLRRATRNLGDIEGEERITGNASEATGTKTKAPSTPGDKDGEQGVRLLKGERGIFFLRRNGASYAMIGFIPERDPLFARKRKRLEEVLAIEAIASRSSRIRAARSVYTKSLKATDVWERGNAAREIEAMARQYGAAFDDDARQYLAERLYQEKNPTIAAALERAVRAVAPDEAFAYAVEAEERERKLYAKALAKEEKYLASNKVAELRAADLIRLANRYGRAATDLLCRHLEDSDALIRESAAGALARSGGPSCRARLRKALEAEADRNAARAMIHTLGVKSDTEALNLIARRLRDQELEQTAVQAIGRIGTKDAWRILRSHRDSASAPARSLIDSLLVDHAGTR